MDLHPIFVHFPIALLTVYSLMEIFTIRSLKTKDFWFYSKTIMLIIGVLGAFASLATGEIAEENYSGNIENLIELHSNFAVATAWIFGIIAGLYLIGIVNKTKIYNPKNELLNKLWKLKIRFYELVIGSFIVKLVAIAGLICITITGALGGVIVYGPQTDPIANLIYSLFF